MTLEQLLAYPDPCKDMYYYNEVGSIPYFGFEVPLLHLYPKMGVPAVVCSFMAILLYALDEGRPGFLVYDRVNDELVPYFTN